VTGEKAGCYKTEILKQFPLPEPPDVKFIYEGTMWRRIDKNYKTKFVNDVFKLYRTDGTDSITRQIKNRQTGNYYSSKYYNYKSALNEIYNYLKIDKKNLYINIFGACKNGIYSGRSMKAILKEVKPFYAKLLIASGYPFFKIIFLLNKRVKK
jgi:hypothetical protein